jgi:crossover junction endodeoxyribonuclease RuvC
MRLILGIDVGLEGALAVLTEDGEFCEVVDLPVMTLGKGHGFVSRQLNGGALIQHLRRINHNHLCTAYIESVAAMPRQGVASMFSFGQSYGTVLTALAASMIPYCLVRPTDWKKHFKLIGSKDDDAGRTLAIQHYPDAELHLKKHHNRADALLIAEYGLKRREE